MPVPVSENEHAAPLRTLADPLARIGTVVVPLSCPWAVPVMVMFPAHVAENSPASVVAVWLVTFHWRLVHVAALGSGLSDCDAHLPRYDCEELGVPPLMLPLGAVGVSGLLLVC